LLAFALPALSFNITVILYYRTDTNGEVANQGIHLPGILPKFPGRFYFYFGKPIETEGMAIILDDHYFGMSVKLVFNNLSS
jgi:hypothetical protein